jgi:hypothetical protein
MANLVGDPKRHKSARWWLTAFYFLLVIGGVTRIYPFWLMITGSVSGSLDFKDRALVPRFLVERDELFPRFLTQGYGDERFLFSAYPVENVMRPIDYRGHLQAPKRVPSATILNDWRQFLREAARPAYLTIADSDRATRLYQAFLKKKFSDASPRGMDRPTWESLAPIERMNRAYHQMEQMFAFVMLPPWKFGQMVNGDAEPSFADYVEFLRSLPSSHLVPISGAHLWQNWLRDHNKPRIAFHPEGRRGRARGLLERGVPALASHSRRDRAGNVHRDLRRIHVGVARVPGFQYVDVDGLAVPVPNQLRRLSLARHGRVCHRVAAHAAGVRLLPTHHPARHHHSHGKIASFMARPRSPSPLCRWRICP